MRKALKISGILFVLYLLTGFLILPFAVKFFGQRSLKKQFGESASITKVTANPFTWQLTVEGLKLEDPAQQWSLELASAQVDVSAATVYKFHPVFDAISVNTPNINYVRSQSEPAEEPTTDTPSGDWREALTNINTLELPKVQIDLLQIEQGTVHFRDESNPDVYSQVITPINFALHEFTTAIENEDVVRFSAKTEQGTSLEFEATLTQNPMTCSGFIQLSGFDVSRLSPYYQQYTQFELASAVFGMRFDYRIDLSDLDNLLVLSEGQLELSDILCRPLTGEERVISLNSAKMSGIHFEFPKLDLQVDRVTLQDGDTRIARNADGSINLLRLVGSSEAPEATEPKAPVANDQATEPSAALTYHFEHIEILDYQLTWADTLSKGEAHVTIDIPKGVIKGASSNLSAPFSVAVDYGFGDAGTAHIEGSVIPAGAQIDLDLTVSSFPLTLLANYADEFADLTLKNGAVDFNGNLKSQPDDRFQITGAVSVSDFDIAMAQPNPLEASWKALAVSGINVMTNPTAIEIDQITLDTPKSQLRLPAKTATDSPKNDTTQTTADTAAPPLDLQIHALSIQSGTITVIDESVQPSGTFTIEKTELTLSNLSFDSPQPTALDLTAKVNQSQLSIKGQLYPANPKQDSSLKIDMAGLALPTFSPYSGKAVGRKIDNGIFTLDANWTVKDSQLKASNKILIDQMNFGDSVKSDTAISLPLDLAVTLLKGVNGEMDLSLPLSGDLSDPKASIWQIVRTAAVGLITNVAAAPFKLLSNLVGTEADLSQVTFDPNSSQLNAESIERLNAIAKALKARPQISLSLAPTLSADDHTALAIATLRATLLEDSKHTDDEAYQKQVKKAYKKQQEAQPESEASNTTEPDLAEMEASLITDLEVPDSARTELAQARAEAVSSYLTTTCEIESERVSINALDGEQTASSVQFDLK